MRTLLLSTAIFAAICAGSSANAATARLFGTAEFRTGSLEALPQWRNVLARIAADEETIRACRQDRKRCASAAGRWVDLLRQLEPLRPRDQMIRVNSYFNKQRYRADDANFGRRDYWASPLEFLRRSGDCEDYAIAKYHALRSLGFRPDDLRLVVVQDTLRNIPHAVLAVYLDGEVHILDNLSAAVSLQGALPHYVPYYSVNESERWAHTPLDAIVVSAARR